MARTSSSNALGERLGLSDDELCQVLDTEPLMLISGQGDDRAELAILNRLLDETELTVTAAALRRWIRTRGPAGRPLDLLLARDFAGFEDALGTLVTRGFVIGGGGSKPH